jgi:hypothetical protein
MGLDIILLHEALGTPELEDGLGSPNPHFTVEETELGGREVSEPMFTPLVAGLGPPKPSDPNFPSPQE